MTGSANPSAQPSQDEIRKIVALYQARNLPETERATRRLLKKHPGAADLSDVLAVVLIEQGKFEQAVACCEQALKTDPRRADAHSNLGIALHELGRHEEAVASFRRALEINPGHADAHNNLGRALREIGKPEDAAASYRQALKYNPRHAGVHVNLAVVLRELGRPEEAMVSYREALKITPNFAEAHTNLGNIYNELGRLDEAVACHRRALEIAPDLTQAHVNLGIALMGLDHLEEAAASFRRALEVGPDSSKAHGNMGFVLQQLGQLDEAIVHYRRALELQPDYAEVHLYLANSTKHAERDADIRNMEGLYESPDCSPEQKMHLGFALGKAFEDLGEYQTSFEYLREANSLNRVALPYAADRTEALFHELEEVCDEAFVNGGGENKSEMPVFIVGMPRAGTSLVEQILASHPAVFGAGELDDLPMVIEAELASRKAPFPAGLMELDDAAFGRLGSTYLERLAARGGGASRVTDKSPHNFLNIGLIARCLPGARIIHVRRDPMDTCFSIYAQLFYGRYPYAYDLIELGHYYRLYEELMAHWRKLVPERMLEVSYETLVAEPETEIRRMLDYCGLPFDPACLEFHKTERPVRTASMVQVRQPLYSDSVGRWRHFEKQLEPLRHALEGKVTPVAG